MPRTPHAYRTTTPWEPFTARERKRKDPLQRCPSSACHRAKACVGAHDNLYCQKSHESLAQFAARLKIPKPASPSKRSLTLKQVQAKRIALDLRLADVEARNAEMTARWKAGEFDALYGKYSSAGVWKYPPERQYTD